MFKKSKKGFTIVELVIVIAVIGILSAILIPTFANLTDQANKTALKSNLASAYAMYAEEAADSVYDADKSAIKFVEQSKAYLVPEGSSELKGYGFTTDGWATELSTTAKTVGSASGNITLVATDSTKSTFGKYVVYYIVD